MKYIAEIEFEGEPECEWCPFLQSWGVEIKNCYIKNKMGLPNELIKTCPLKPMSDSVTDTESKDAEITTLKERIAKEVEINNILRDRLLDNGESASSEPEPTNADIMAEIKAVREDIRSIREGERRP